MISVVQDMMMNLNLSNPRLRLLGMSGLYQSAVSCLGLFGVSVVVSFLDATVSVLGWC